MHLTDDLRRVSLSDCFRCPSGREAFLYSFAMASLILISGLSKYVKILLRGFSSISMREFSLQVVTRSKLAMEMLLILRTARDSA